jgi:site-specific DNA recombinase
MRPARLSEHKTMTATTPRIATYARFSSDKQRDASIEDQTRNCRTYASRHDWAIALHFEDRAVSGASKERPGFQAMLNAAHDGKFDVLLVDDLSRFSRDDIETKTLIRRFKYEGLRIIGVSDGYDSTAKGEKIQSSMRGLMNEMFLDDLREKTHRGLTGQALNGNSTGGRSYGYVHRPITDPNRCDPYGQPLVIAAKREINPEHAKVVVQIYDLFAKGWSPRAIAKKLNEQGIPSPRGGKWLQSAIYGDKIEGTGILNNALYSGRVVWNRRQWLKNPDTGRRTYIKRPESEWIITDMPELRIVDVELWDKVKARQTRLQTEMGDRIKQGLRASSAKGCSSGRGFKYLFSGLLKCAHCGANFVMHSVTSYGCAQNLNGGHAACPNEIRLPRRKAEKKLLDVVRQQLLTPEACVVFMGEVKKQLHARAAEMRTSINQAQRDADALQREIDNIMTAIKAGVVTPTTRAALEAAEGKKAKADTRLQTVMALDERAITRMTEAMPDVLDRYRKTLDNIGTALEAKLEHSRMLLQTLLGEITLHKEKHGLEAVLNLDWLETLSGSEELEKLKVLMVARVGFEPTTFGL